MRSYDGRSLKDLVSIKMTNAFGGYIPGYDWEIVDVSEQHLELQFNFKEIEYVNSDVFVGVMLEFSDFEPGWDDEEILLLVPLTDQEEQLDEA